MTRHNDLWLPLEKYGNLSREEISAFCSGYKVYILYRNLRKMYLMGRISIYIFTMLQGYALSIIT
jgi:hypothetical protein